MDKSTIQTLIDKVIGKKGLLRTPSWWMRKVLMQIADWIQEGDDANSEKIGKIKEETDSRISTFETNINNKVSTFETNTNSKISTLETSTNNKISVLETNSNNKISTLETRLASTNNVLFELIETAKLPISIKCFTVKTGSQSGYVIVDGVNQSIPANTKIVVPFITEFRFGIIGGNTNPISFIGFTATDTSSVTTMENMFFNCVNLASLDLSRLDTSSVTNMHSMFSVCTYLTSLNLTGLDTSSVTNMENMFYYCSKLTSLDLSGFDTSSVTNMKGMFSYCKNLTSLNLTGLDTSSVTTIENMFSDCHSLTSLDLAGFNTSAVTNMYQMFLNCRSLTSLDLSSFDTSKVTAMNSMFSECSSLTSLILGPNFFKTPAVTSIFFTASTQWTNDTVVTSLVTNSYDRAAAGLKTMTLQLSANTKASLTDEQKAAITAKGYTIA